MAVYFICIALLTLQMPSTRNTVGPTSAYSSPKTTPTCYVRRTEIHLYEPYAVGARSTRPPSNPDFRNTSSPPLHKKPETLISWAWWGCVGTLKSERYLNYFWFRGRFTPEFETVCGWSGIICMFGVFSYLFARWLYWIGSWWRVESRHQNLSSKKDWRKGTRSGKRVEMTFWELFFIVSKSHA